MSKKESKKERAAYNRGFDAGVKFMINHEKMHKVVAQAFAELKVKDGDPVIVLDEFDGAKLEAEDEQYCPMDAQKAMYNLVMDAVIEDELRSIDRLDLRGLPTLPRTWPMGKMWDIVRDKK